jgi:hypothetical protein
MTVFKTVTLATQPVVVTHAADLVLWHGYALGREEAFETGGRICKLTSELDIQQVEAVTELDDGSEDGGVFDAGVFAFRLLHGPL